MQLKSFGVAALVAASLLAVPQKARASEGGNATWTPQPSITFQSLLGARASSFSASGGNTAYGGGASIQQSGYLTISYLTLRGSSIGSLGSSAEGFEGYQSSDLTLGVILPLGDAGGPFARIGARGYMFGNEAVWLSNFEIPAGNVGYQYMAGPWLFEAAGRTGMIVTGRHTHYATVNGFDVLERRRLGQPSLEYGGHVTFGYDFFRAEVEYMRINVADQIGTPLLSWSASACVRKDWYGGCLDYRRWEADVPRVDGTISPLAVAYGGISIGIWSP